MKLGFLKWPFEGTSITDSWSVYNFNILKTQQPVNNLFSHPKRNTVFAQTTIELWLRKTPYAQKQIQPDWYNISDGENIDCDAVIIPYTWFLFFTKEHFISLSKYKGKVILDETTDPWLFDETNGNEDIIPNFLKEVQPLVNYDNFYFLTSAGVSEKTKNYFSKRLNNIKIISANVLMLLLSVSSRQNKQRLYSDEFIIQNFNSKKDKDFLLCAGRPRQHRLALIKYLSDHNLLEKGFVSTNLAPHVGDSIRPFVEKYLQDMSIDKSRYCLTEFCELEELKNFADTKILKEYSEEYFRLVDPYPKNNVYNRSKFSIISETLFQTYISGYNWITEKTCLPFIYGHPFQLFAMANTWKYLESLGFEQYSIFGVYDSITSPYNRFQFLCDQILYFNENPLNNDLTLEKLLHNTNNFYSDTLQDSIVSSIVDQIQ